MHGFEATRANELMADLGVLNKSIDTALASAEQLHITEIEQISSLCEQRAILFAALKEWRNSTDGAACVADNNDAWQKAIDCMEQDDSKRAEVLKQKIANAAAQLRSTMQQKSLLLYQRGGYSG